MSDENPFDMLGIDPCIDREELTAALRRLAERADPEERKHLQGLWRKLTLRDSDRVRLALWAHPNPGGRGHKTVDELRDAVSSPPPAIDAPEIAPTIADALVIDTPVDHPEKQSTPPTAFDRMKPHWAD